MKERSVSPPADRSEARTARAWREEISIPTYGVGTPDRNPMFLEKRVYQGSSGAVYPWPIVDRIGDDKSDRRYQAIFLENEFLKIMILPELGGRVQMACDKTNGYHFVYYNRVIKPALVGLAGPWISGGIEFNWPQHHRPSTFTPVAGEIVADHTDGSVTVWLNEIDRMHRTQGTHGLTLRPGRAVLEVHVRLSNRSDLPQTFLWWANPAVHADDNHQSVFPPDVHAVMDHGKRDVISFPIAIGQYYKVDYSPGTDISRYRNIPVPTSYMACHSDYDFVGSYDHGRRAGLLHVCNHHISPGKKQWTWGNSDFGHAWDRHLTDDDGPYVELMCGVYTDNQPDFSWLMPGEEKSFTQYFMPYQGVGMVRNATVDAAVGLDVHQGVATVRAYTTTPQAGAKAVLRDGQRLLMEEDFDGGPGTFFEASVPLRDEASGEELSLEILDAAGHTLVSWQVPAATQTEIPQPAQAIKRPAQLDTVEALYLAGIHLEQYRHATREPADYYREGLSRDPGDSRCNHAMGQLLYRRGRFAEAEPYLRRAIERLTRHNPNPRDSEPYFNLGVTLEAQERFAEAYAAYHKAVWHAAEQAAGYFALARLDCRAGRYRQALENVDRCLAHNTVQRRAQHLKVCLLALNKRSRDAIALAQELLRADVFQVGALYEQIVLTDGAFDLFDQRMGDDQHNYVELALDYASAGRYALAVDVLQHYLRRVDDRPATAIVFYLLADYHQAQERHHDAAQAYAQAARYQPDYCFPNRLEEIGVLTRAMQARPGDAKAPYYLGNLWYDRRQYDLAMECWERARDLDPTFPTVWRNLGLAYFNKRQNATAAWAAFSEAFRLDATDARVLFEWDQLAKRLGHTPQARLDRLEQYPALVTARDDLYLEHVTLLNLSGHFQQGLDRLLARRFHPWEGGEGKVSAQYTLSLTQLARACLQSNRAPEAMDWLRRAEQWPQTLGEGKLPGLQENNVHYLMGMAWRQQHQERQAVAYLERAAVGLSEPTSPTYYNDQPPDMIFYQGMALAALGRKDEAHRRFKSLIEYGKAHLADEPTIDYFAVSLPDFLVFDEDLTVRNQLHCQYMLALGFLGQGDRARAMEHFEQVLAADPSHVGASIHRPLADSNPESMM